MSGHNSINFQVPGLRFPEIRIDEVLLEAQSLNLLSFPLLRIDCRYKTFLF